jgi:glycosyltransferase EpsF
MKVLTIVTKMGIGGIEKRLLTSIPFFKAHDIELFIACAEGGELEEECRKEGVEILHLNRTRFPLYEGVQLNNLLKQHHFDIIHSRIGHNSGVLAKVSAKHNIPFVLSIHNEIPMFRLSWQNNKVLSMLRQSFLDYHKRLSLKYASKIIGVSKATLRYFKGDPKTDSKCQLVYNGVNFEKLDSIQPEFNTDFNKFLEGCSCTLIHIGVFKEQKNHRFLIDCFKELDPVKNNYKLILVGGGSLLQEMQNRVNDYGLSNNVWFTGWENNIITYLKVADLFFFPSLNEGLPGVLVEAQYLNVPICASDIEPNIEAAFEYYHKFLFDAKDKAQAVEKLELAIAEIKADKLDDIIKNARQFVVDTFSLKRMVDEFVGIYKSLLQR